MAAMMLTIVWLMTVTKGEKRASSRLALRRLPRMSSTISFASPSTSLSIPRVLIVFEPLMASAR